MPDLDPGDAPEGMELHAIPEDDAWVEGRSLVATVEDVELLDPAVSAERLLYRLFHQRGVRVFRASALNAECSCSRRAWRPCSRASRRTTAITWWRTARSR